MSDEPDDFNVPYMFLADSAEALGGKLYVLGGGWDRLLIPNLPGPSIKPFSLALAVMVPYSHTNRKFTLSIELVDSDGKQLGQALQIGLDSGRPPGLTAGTPQSVPVAITMNPTFPGPSRYSVVARIDGSIKNNVSFEVMPLQVPFVPPAPVAG
jgi:hypothetical protein